jgi:hypothetical protein
MVIINLLLSLVLLLAANLLTRAGKWRILIAVGFGIFVTWLSPAFDLPTLAILAIFVQSVVLCVMIPIFAGSNRRFIPYWAASILVTVCAFCIPIAVRLNDYHEYVELRAKVPYVSLEERLPKHLPVPGRILTADSSERLAEVETSIGRYYMRMRTYELKRLHESTTWEFINRPGFGYSRMMRPLSMQEVIKYERTPIPQATTGLQVTSTSEQTALPRSSWNANELQEFHQKSIVDFVNPPGFGDVKDRHHVAGFDSHGFGTSPEPAKPLQLVSLELVGLLRDEPVVYLSEYLPLMSELRQAPTRTLNQFESAGLETLRAGEDLFVKPSETNLRILGSIRSTKQCIECHGGERGDLLGAFSYVLR